MSSSDLPANLRLLCSYGRSVSATCRRIGMSRQQFTKYLSGSSQPSLSNLRKIADHFGLDDHELLIDQASFRRLVSIKRPIAPDIANLTDMIRETLFLTKDSMSATRSHIGFYHNYFMPLEHPNKILRALFHVYEDNGFIVSRNVERYPGHHNVRVRKYNGIFAHSGDKIVMFERESTIGRALWLSILYPYDVDHPSLLSGLTLGVTRSSSRPVACYRVVLEYLGRDIQLREAMARCGLHDADSPEIDPDIRSGIRNDILPYEDAFVARS